MLVLLLVLNNIKVINSSFVVVVIAKQAILIKLTLYSSKLKINKRILIMTNIKTSPFDVAEYLTDETLINAYLNEILAEGVPSEFIQALNDVTRAMGINKLVENKLD